MTVWKIYGKPCEYDDCCMMSSMGGRVKQIGKTKKRPAMPPTGIHKLIAHGTFRVGSATSSAIEEIMPMAENVYAAGKRPIKKVNPPYPEKVESKWPRA